MTITTIEQYAQAMAVENATESTARALRFFRTLARQAIRDGDGLILWRLVELSGLLEDDSEGPEDYPLQRAHRWVTVLAFPAALRPERGDGLVREVWEFQRDLRERIRLCEDWRALSSPLDPKGHG